VTRRRILARVVLAAALLWTGACLTVGAVHVAKPLPAGIPFDGEPIPVPGARIRFLADLSYVAPSGEPVREQEVFDAVLAAVAAARRRLVLDMFLLNPHAGAAGEVHRALSGELTAALKAARRAHPELVATLVTDPINDTYGGDPSRQLATLADAGVAVVRTDLGRLRDSNPAWSAAWRLAMSWLGNDDDGGWLPHPFAEDGPPVTLRTWLRLLNFKANHRKVVVADDGGGWRVLVTSMNPHDASSAHSNVALEVSDARLAAQAVAAEAAVVAFSRTLPLLPPLPDPSVPATGGDHTVRVVTETAIRDALLEALTAAGGGDEVDVAVFYLSHDGVIDGLVGAARRGAAVRVVLDPARDAFGHTKSGVPNRQAARRLLAASDGRVAVRFYATHGEQFHTKLVAVRSRDRTRLLLGSANLTRRNLDGYNLEANLDVTMPRGSVLDLELRSYMDRIWSNRDGTYTVEYDELHDPSLWRRALARWQEATGMGTF